MSRRRNLLGVVAGLAATPQIAAAKGVHSVDPPSSDAALVAMAAELRAIEAAYNIGCGTSDEFCKSPEGEGLMERLEDIIDQMAETPANGLEGIAAKAGRLCFSLHPRSGGTLMNCEMPLLASLAEDLARLAPEAVGGMS